MIYIGIDAGATKTHAIISDGTKIIAEENAGPANHHIVGWGQSVKEIVSTIKNLLIKTDTHHEELSICIGMAGVDTKTEEDEAIQKIREVIGNSKKIKLHIVNDTLIALESGSQNNNAIVIICGTGSNCFGRNDEGVEIKVGGLDYLLSDEASGYMMGSMALRAATKSLDGRGQKTLLEDLLTKKLQIGSLRDAQKVIYEKNWKKNEIAACAYLVFDAAEKGDSVANDIINNAIFEATLMVKTAAQKLSRTEIDVVCAGGLFDESMYKKKFEEDLKKSLPLAKCIFPSQTPAWGAVRVALRNNL